MKNKNCVYLPDMQNFKIWALSPKKKNSLVLNATFNNISVISWQRIKKKLFSLLTHDRTSLVNVKLKHD